MSDSDDTDILLLIPPDFFTVHQSDSEDLIPAERYINGDIVNGLISQVSNLENRLSIIEIKENLNATSITSCLPADHFKDEIMSQQTWHTLNASTPQSRSSRASSLPPTPTGSFVSGAPLFYRTNSYPSPSKSISPDKNKTRQHNGLSSNGDVTTDMKIRGYMSQLPSRQDPNRVPKSRNAETMKEVDAFFEKLRGRYENRPSDTVNIASPGFPAPVRQLGLKEVDQLLEKMEAEQQEIEAKLSVRERQYGLPVGEEVVQARHIKSFPGDHISSVPDLDLGVRKLWDDKVTQPSLKRPVPNDRPTENDDGVVEEVCTQKKYGLLEKGEPKSNSYSNGQGSVKYVDENEKTIPKVFASRRRLDLESSTRPDIARLPEEISSFDVSNEFESAPLLGGPITSRNQPENFSVGSDSPPGKSSEAAAAYNHGVRGDQQQIRSNNKGIQENFGKSIAPPPMPSLMSLANLWGEKKNAPTLSLEQRLEEEKCRREHCENMVQTLQTRLLEAQQRIAVAQRVDSEKDAAIKHLHSTWTRIMDAWNGLEEERNTLANELQNARAYFKSEREQLSLKLAKCENELSKALDLAHGYKEQAATAERTRTEQLESLGEKVQEVERRLAAATQANAEAERRETELCDQLAKEIKKVAELQTSLSNVKKVLTQHEADVAVLNDEKSTLQAKLKEERSRADTFQKSRDTIRKEAEEAGKRERALQAEVRQLTQQLSSIKSELRDFYQEQLERAVRDKLSEFQSQLDAAETSLHREAENRELAMAELAARQLKQLNSKHKQEVVLLEQRHAEHLHLLQLQKAEAEQNVLEMRKRLEEHEANASNLAQRLHGIMQNQWREALSVVSGSKGSKPESKPISHVPPSKSDYAGDGDNSDVSAGNSWRLVKQQEQQERRRQRQQKEQQEYSNQNSHRSKWEGLSSNDEIPFEQEGKMTQRSTSTTNVNPQGGNSSGDSGEELKRYIKMLLDRAPGRPYEAPTLPSGSDNGKAGKITDKAQTSGGRDSRSSGGKPPWK